MTSYGVIPSFSPGYLRHVDLDAEPALAGALDDRRCQPRRTQVLHGDHAIDVERFKTRFEKQLFEKWVANLNDAAMRLLGILNRCERGPVNAVPSGVCAHENHKIPNSRCLGPHDGFMTDDSDAHGVHKWVAAVCVIEKDVAGHRRYAETIAVATDSADHSLEQVSIARFAERAKAQRVQQCDWSCPHREDVTHDTADAGCGALVWLNCRWMVV
jgi:hypothetical protein